VRMREVAAAPMPSTKSAVIRSITAPAGRGGRRFRRAALR
jgi:hypothetical protein